MRRVSFLRHTIFKRLCLSGLLAVLMVFVFFQSADAIPAGSFIPFGSGAGDLRLSPDT